MTAGAGAGRCALLEIAIVSRIRSTQVWLWDKGQHRLQSDEHSSGSTDIDFDALAEGIGLSLIGEDAPPHLP